MSALYGEVRATLHARLGSWNPTSASSLQGKVPDTTELSSEGWLPGEYSYARTSTRPWPVPNPRRNPSRTGCTE